MREIRGTLAAADCARLWAIWDAALAARKKASGTIVVTRHPALVELLRERGLISGEWELLSHCTPEQVRGRHVIGVLPLSLAAVAERVTEIPLDLTPELRGVELDLPTLRRVAGEAVTYRVTCI